MEKTFEKISFLRWFRVTIGGYLLGLSISIAYGIFGLFSNEHQINISTSFKYLLMVVCGIAFGIFQTFILRKINRIGLLWILLHPIGLCIGLYVNSLPSDSEVHVISNGSETVMSSSYVGNCIVVALQSLLLMKIGFRKIWIYFLLVLISGSLQVATPRLLYFLYSNIGYDIEWIFSPMKLYLLLVSFNVAVQSWALSYIYEQTFVELGTVTVSEQEV